MAGKKSTMIACCGRPCVDHNYHDCVVYRRAHDYLFRIAWGSMQHRAEEHGRIEFSGRTLIEARDTALAETDDVRVRGYIHSAYAEAVEAEAEAN
jgi:hypothetical protein